MAFEKPVVIIDNGSHLIKAGFSCDNHPVSMFRTVVGRPKELNGKYGRPGYHYDVYVGDEAEERKEFLDVTSPIENGRIKQWDNMERIWHHCFYRELKVAPEDRAVFLTCSPYSPMSEKIKCCEVFFEALNVPAISMQNTGVMALYGGGCTTGLSVDLGYDEITICPVYEGRLISHAIMRTGYAGRQVCQYIEKSLADRDISLGYEAEEVVDKVIHDILYITKDVAMKRLGYERTCKTKEGEIDVSQEAFMAAEMIFQPELVMGGKTEYKSLVDAIITCLNKVESDLWDEMLDNLVLCGGMAMIPGLAERLNAELQLNLNRPVNLVFSEESYCCSWMGATNFASIKESQRLFITRKQFTEHGEKIVKNRYF